MNHALRKLLSECRRDVDITAGLRAAQDGAEAGPDLLDDLAAQLERSDQAAVVTLVGSTGAGKSSLLNALVRADIAQPGTTRPTTSAPVIYAPRDADLGALLDDLPGAAPRVETYARSKSDGPAGPWTEQILIDAPDTNSVAEEHRAVVRALAERSDVLVLLAHRQSVAELAAVSFVDDFAGRRGLVFVLGRGDELEPPAREALARQIRDLAADRWGVKDAVVHVVSPLRARSDPDDPAWQKLEAELEALVAGGRLGAVRRHNALGTLGRLQTLYARVQSEAGDGLALVDAELSSGLARWRAGVAGAVHDRLALRGPELAHLLWNEVGRRWDGPGGLAVRAGGLSALGLGAGAMLARRNPLLAAGAAATAVAADRARGALQERSFLDSSGLVPGSGELQDLEREALGPARLAADQAGDDLALDATLLAPAASSAVNEAWTALAERDLPAQAARSAGPVLRLAIDVPVYGFGAWVVYCAGRGFWSGSYVGVDFLVNAALLAGAWLFLARGLVRAGLRRRADGLLATVGAAIDSQLDRATEQLAESVQLRTRERREALGRLAEVETRASARLLGAGHQDPG